MCAACETRKLVERLEKQIKNIDAGGSISPVAIAALLRDARERITAQANAAMMIGMIASGKVAGAIVEVGGADFPEPDHSGGVH